MKHEQDFNNLVGTSSKPQEFDDLWELIIFSISLGVVQENLILGKECWYTWFKEKESLF